MDTILSIVSGSTAGALVALLFRGWITERLKQSIQHEYSQKLETYKAELNTRIQAIQHENQLYQLRTSLFFDHQRNAFAGLLAQIAETNRKWVDKEYNGEEGFTGHVPDDAYKDLRTSYFRHQLFLDNSCLAAMELVFDCYGDSFPTVDGSGEQLQPGDADSAYEAVEYLQPRLAELFQNRIGVTTNHWAEREIALFGAIRLLNRYHFTEIELPPGGSLKLTHRDRSADAVAKAEDNYEELLSTLRRFQDHLRRDGGIFHEAAMKASRYLTMLVPNMGGNE